MRPDLLSLGGRQFSVDGMFPRLLSHFAAPTEKSTLRTLAYQPTVDGSLPEILPTRDVPRKLTRSKLSNASQILKSQRMQLAIYLKVTLFTDRANNKQWMIKITEKTIRVTEEVKFS